MKTSLGISIFAALIAQVAQANDKAIVRDVPLAPGASVEYLDFNGVPTQATHVDVIEIKGKRYATYQSVAVGETDSFKRCKTVRKQAEKDAFELCRSQGGKDCRMALLITGPVYHEADCEEDDGADVCSVKAYAIDLANATLPTAPVSFLKYNRMMNGMIYPNF